MTPSPADVPAARVIPLVDDSPRYATLAAVTPLFGLPELSEAGSIAELLTDASPWMLACAAYYAGARDITPASARLEQLLAHDDSVVREAAFAALARLISEPRWRSHAALLVDDHFAPLAARARLGLRP